MRVNGGRLTKELEWAAARSENLRVRRYPMARSDMMATFLGRSPPRFSFREAIQGLDLQDFATRCILAEEEDGRLEFDLVWLKPLHGTRPIFFFQINRRSK
jgi:hypothetical protein